MTKTDAAHGGGKDTRMKTIAIMNNKETTGSPLHQKVAFQSEDKVDKTVDFLGYDGENSEETGGSLSLYRHLQIENRP